MKLVTSFFALCMFAHSALACCMVPASYPGSISQNAHEAVIFHHNGVQDMILRINYEIAGEGMPDRFAWVVTVPHAPDNYALADKALYKDVFNWAYPLVDPPKRSVGCSAMYTDSAVAGGLELGERVEVGPYDIQPVKARGADALGALNDWLAKNGFPTEDPKHMTYFVEQGFTFLCIKVNPAKGKTAVNKGGDLEPLHLTFKTENVYYPLRFSSRQGVFDVSLAVLTRQKLNYKKSDADLKKINWVSRSLRRNVKVSSSDFPKTLAEAYAKSSFKNQVGQPWYLNVIRTRRTNYENAIAQWKADVFFQVSGHVVGAKKKFWLF